MRLLLDTNALFWLLGEPERLADPPLRAIEDESSIVYASVISVWELTIKAGKGKLHMPPNIGEALDEQRLATLSVTLSHVTAVEALPPVHRDPFDRMLVAQALCEELALVTSDRAMRHYPIATMPAT